MTAAQFEAATPREIQWRLEALDAADEAADLRIARLAAWVLTPLGVKVTAEELLGIEPERPFTF